VHVLVLNRDNGGIGRLHLKHYYLWIITSNHAFVIYNVHLHLRAFDIVNK
jgi:hypothetical protein